MDSLLEDIFNFASLVPRVASHFTQTDYLGDVDDMDELSEIREEILRRVKLALHKVVTYSLVQSTHLLDF